MSHQTKAREASMGNLNEAILSLHERYVSSYLQTLDERHRRFEWRIVDVSRHLNPDDPRKDWETAERWTYALWLDGIPYSEVLLSLTRIIGQDDLEPSGAIMYAASQFGHPSWRDLPSLDPLPDFYAVFMSLYRKIAVMVLDAGGSLCPATYKTARCVSMLHKDVAPITFLLGMLTGLCRTYLSVESTNEITRQERLVLKFLQGSKAPLRVTSDDVKQWSSLPKLAPFDRAAKALIDQAMDLYQLEPVHCGQLVENVSGTVERMRSEAFSQLG